MKPITVFTGLNSTGKSSVLQSVLVLNKELTLNGIRYLENVNSTFFVEKYLHKCRNLHCMRNGERGG